MRRNYQWSVMVSFLVLLVLVACSAPAATEPPPTDPVEIIASPEHPTVITATNTAAPTATKQPTQTPRPTSTPQPSPTPDITLFAQGTYLVGVDIQPGLYVGQAGVGLMNSCYWERKKDLLGEFSSILANNNAEGQFYVQILETDFAFEVHCDVHYLETMPAPVAEFPTTLIPGTYLVGIDIKPGLYKGQAGDDILDSCYWERQKNATGALSSILANGNATGQYFIQVSPTDFALKVNCEVVFQK